jgi:septal ring factor EnvC (AmiA/AmiB activator)
MMMDKTPEDTNSITGKAITRCKDCAAWEKSSTEDFGICHLNAPVPVKSEEEQATYFPTWPITNCDDGCTEAPDWTVKDMEGTAALSVEFHAMQKRFEDLEIARREDADWADSTNKDLLKLSRRIRALEQRLDDSTSPDAAGVMRLDSVEVRLSEAERAIAREERRRLTEADVYQDIVGRLSILDERVSGTVQESLIQRLNKIEEWLGPPLVGEWESSNRTICRRLDVAEKNSAALSVDMEQIANGLSEVEREMATGLIRSVRSQVENAATINKNHLERVVKKIGSVERRLQKLQKDTDTTVVELSGRIADLDAELGRFDVDTPQTKANGGNANE